MACYKRVGMECRLVISWTLLRYQDTCIAGHAIGKNEPEQRVPENIRITMYVKQYLSLTESIFKLKPNI